MAVINEGDIVIVSHNNHARGALGQQFEAALVAFPTQQFPYWILETATHVKYMDNITVSKLL